ncbi:MAG: hypothetical protein ACYDH5_15735 [Acidimicrobiales bacterium]
MITANPFSYGQPVTGASFTGRERELDALIARVRSHINVVATNVLLCRDVNVLAARLTAGAYRIPGARCLGRAQV